MQFPHSINLDEIIGNPDLIAWDEHVRFGRVGARIHCLYQDAVSGQRVALVHCRPGAHARLHLHNGHETFLVLDGTFHDESGIYAKGDLVVYRPGTKHAWHAPDGALIYAVWGGTVSTPIDN